MSHAADCTSVTLPTPADRRQQRFERLVACHLPALSRTARRLCRHREAAEDVVQETLLRAWRSLDQLRDAEAAKAWVFMILRREAYRSFQRAPPAGIDAEVAGLFVEDKGFDVDAIALHRAVRELDDSFREPLELYAFAGYELGEIAATLGVQRGTVKTRLFRARQRLRSTLEAVG